MKQKGKSQGPVTKNILRTEIKNLEERLDKKFITQGFFRYEMDKTKQELDDNAKKYRDQLLEKLDGVMGELGTMREENTIGAYQTVEIRTQVEDHEKRIKHLEKVQQAT